jgi:hypothetical protein
MTEILWWNRARAPTGPPSCLYLVDDWNLVAEEDEGIHWAAILHVPDTRLESRGGRRRGQAMPEANNPELALSP